MEFEPKFSSKGIISKANPQSNIEATLIVSHLPQKLLNKSLSLSLIIAEIIQSPWGISADLSKKFLKTCNNLRVTFKNLNKLRNQPLKVLKTTKKEQPSQVNSPGNINFSRQKAENLLNNRVFSSPQETNHQGLDRQQKSLSDASNHTTNLNNQPTTTKQHESNIQVLNTNNQAPYTNNQAYNINNKTSKSNNKHFNQASTINSQALKTNNEAFNTNNLTQEDFVAKYCNSKVPKHQGMEVTGDHFFTSNNMDFHTLKHASNTNNQAYNPNDQDYKINNETSNTNNKGLNSNNQNLTTKDPAFNTASNPNNQASNVKKQASNNRTEVLQTKNQALKASNTSDKTPNNRSSNTKTQAFEPDIKIRESMRSSPKKKTAKLKKTIQLPKNSQIEEKKSENEVEKRKIIEKGAPTDEELPHWKWYGYWLCRKCNNDKILLWDTGEFIRHMRSHNIDFEESEAEKLQHIPTRVK